jgi:hypothetical protein
MDICSIKSQVNEQANSGLGQLAYMKQNNFAFTLSLFLFIVNKDKIRALDISSLALCYTYAIHGNAMFLVIRNVPILALKHTCF